MPTFFRLISEYFWLIALGFGAFNYRKAHRALATSVPINQTSEVEICLKRFALGANVPWVVMGLGQASGCHFSP